MKKMLFAIASLIAGCMAASAQTSTYGLYQSCQLQTSVGQAVPGAKVYFLTQPANTSSLTPQAQVYSSSTGGAVTQPLTTNGYGQCSAYLTPGTYTVCYVSAYTGQFCFPDQNIPAPTGSTQEVASATISAGGSYSVCPTGVTFSGGDGSGAAGTPICTLSGSTYFVSGITITAGGSYVNVPSITFTGGTGSGASAIAVMSSVPGVTPIVGGGTGANSAPTAISNLGGLSVTSSTLQSMAGPLSTPTLSVGEIVNVVHVDGLMGTGHYQTINAAWNACLNFVYPSGCTLDARGSSAIPYPSGCTNGQQTNCPDYIGDVANNINYTGSGQGSTKNGMRAMWVELGCGTDYYGTIQVNEGLKLEGCGRGNYLNGTGTIITTPSTSPAGLQIAPCKGCASENVEIKGILFEAAAGNTNQFGFDGDCSGFTNLQSIETGIAGTGTASTNANGTQYFVMDTLIFRGYQGPGIDLSCDSSGGAFGTQIQINNTAVWRSDPAGLSGRATAYVYDSINNLLQVTVPNTFVAGQTVTVHQWDTTDPLFALNGQSFIVSSTGLSTTQIELIGTGITTSTSTATDAVMYGSSVGTGTGTGFNYSSGTLTILSQNNFLAGQPVLISASGGDALAALNNGVYTVLSSGLSSSQFEISVTGSFASSGATSAVAVVEPQPMLLIEGDEDNIVVTNSNFDALPISYGGGSQLTSGEGFNVVIGSFGTVPGMTTPLSSSPGPDQNPVNIHINVGQIQYGRGGVQCSGCDLVTIKGIDFESIVKAQATTTGILLNSGAVEAGLVEVYDNHFGDVGFGYQGCLLQVTQQGLLTYLYAHGNLNNASYPVCMPTGTQTFPATVHVYDNYFSQNSPTQGVVPYFNPTSQLVTFTGGGCTTEPGGKVTVSSAGVILTAQITNGGAGCGSQPTFTPPFGTGANITVPSLSGGSLPTGSMPVVSGGTGYGYSVNVYGNDNVEVCSVAPLAQLYSNIEQGTIAVTDGCATPLTLYGTEAGAAVPGDLLLGVFNQPTLSQYESATFRYNDYEAASGVYQLKLVYLNVAIQGTDATSYMGWTGSNHVSGDILYISPGGSAEDSGVALSSITTNHGSAQFCTATLSSANTSTSTSWMAPVNGTFSALEYTVLANTNSVAPVYTVKRCAGGVCSGGSLSTVFSITFPASGTTYVSPQVSIAPNATSNVTWGSSQAFSADDTFYGAFTTGTGTSLQVCIAAIY